MPSGRTAHRRRPCTRSADARWAGKTSVPCGTRSPQLLPVDGDMAYEVGVERGHGTMAGEQVAIEQRVTNVYHREDGAWKVVHHHTDLSPAMMELLARLQAKG